MSLTFLRIKLELTRHVVAEMLPLTVHCAFDSLQMFLITKSTLIVCMVLCVVNITQYGLHQCDTQIFCMPR